MPAPAPRGALPSCSPYWAMAPEKAAPVTLGNLSSAQDTDL